MSVLPIIQLEKKDFTQKGTIIRQISQQVSDFGADFQKFIDELVDTLKDSPISIGLSAPQVGKLVRVSVINLNEGKKEPTLIIINPQVISWSGKKDKKKESCMSLPHYRGEVERRKKVTLAFQDRYGTQHQEIFEGFLAHVIGHEVDHLDGILYIDRMKKGTKLEPVDFFKNT
ncbi:MAG: peptide deformylase [Candidatus Pacebacteria bacterium]|nr:peptide deformylase [Candidatus Paceibacterota bacterium]